MRFCRVALLLPLLKGPTRLLRVFQCELEAARRCTYQSDAGFPDACKNGGMMDHTVFFCEFASGKDERDVVGGTEVPYTKL
jgi:hypothetical protein